MTPKLKKMDVIKFFASGNEVKSGGGSQGEPPFLNLFYCALQVLVYIEIC